ncbi:hypothetical protein [Planctopirus hydrillae]|uniref:Uncharacterized protein n=1 Tax=Planctopirus hydrillae TaxID=1841610 RepID=A0A1C3EDE0_9PLAN|nr:hypothetical protein [Planctopirus hydrillae]ODA31267.1 hypothetical protein A6X21_22625 [Planctopirus hydrillae]
MTSARLLILLDWTAGAGAGVLMILLRFWLAELYQLPAELMLTFGMVNLAYASFSFILWLLSRKDYVPGLQMIAAANILWAIVCLAMFFVWWGTASFLGAGHFVGEALIVGGMGLLEWRVANQQAIPSLPSEVSSGEHIP